MEQLLMWSGFVAASITLLALGLAQASRWRSLGLVVLGVTALALAAAVGAAGLLCIAAYAGTDTAGRLFWGLLPGLVVGQLSGALAWFARQRPAGLPPRASTWPRARLAGLLVAICVVTATSAHNALLSAQRALDARRAELVSLEQTLRPGLPAALNAAPLYEAARLRATPALGDARAALDAGLVDAPALLEWTRVNAAALALATEGAQRPGYQRLAMALERAAPGSRSEKILELERSRDGRDATDLEDQHTLHLLADLLRVRALQHAHAGRFTEAMADASALLALAEQTDSPWLKPETLIAQLLATPGLTAETLATLRLPRGEGLLPLLQLTLVRSEREALDVLGALTAGDPSDAVGTGALQAMGALRSEAWQRETVERFDRLWDAIYAPPAQRAAALADRAERLAALSSAGRADTGHFIWGVPALWATEALQARLAHEAQRRSMEAGVAAARYRLAHGAWPASLAALVPDLLAAIPLDPFDGAPLRYSASDAEVRISSVGREQKDDVAFAITTSK